MDNVKTNVTNKKLDNNVEIANKISAEHKLIYCAYDFYEYKEGAYRKLHKITVQSYIKDILGYEYKTYKAEEIMNILSIDHHVVVEELNNTKYLNLKNGLYDLQMVECKPHALDIYSTIQLPITYNPEANCKKWCNTVYDIFEYDEDKVMILQEFFGLCLTPDTKYEKALFLIGDGSNGKSTILFVLEKILGEYNYTAIPLERLDNPHYVANLFNKLANISIETNAKSAVYDAMFKAIISGDSITADPKYKKPFQFRPYCKLIYALNNMPRVDDKTSAFFRRLLILRFNKQYSELEANKNLKYELLEELDGIFLWLLEGLRKLRKRGYFLKSEEMQREVNEYRAENNNVITFVEEECELGKNAVIDKQALYFSYSEWCKGSGYRALSKSKFGKELKKQYPSITDDRTSIARKWYGVVKGLG